MDGFPPPINSGSRGSVMSAAFGEKGLRRTFNTATATGQRHEDTSQKPGPMYTPYQSPVLNSELKGKVTESNFGDVARKTKEISETAKDFLNSLLNSLGVKDEVEIRFDEVITNQKTTTMYLVLPKDGVLIDRYREILGKEDVSYFNFEVNYNRHNPKKVVLNEMLADVLIIITKYKLISIKGDEVLRDSWGKNGGSISIGPKNALYSQTMAMVGDKSDLYRRYSYESTTLPPNTVFDWKSPDDFIQKYQSGELTKSLSQVKGLENISVSLPTIPTQNLRLLEEQ